MRIRKATEDYIPLIRQLTSRVWPQTYIPIIGEEQVNYMLEMMYSAESLTAQLKEGNEFIIVYDGEEPVGFASFGLVSPNTYKLHKLYVLTSMHGKGAGRYMIGEIIKKLIERNARQLLLNVNRNNPAKKFYEKLGFTVIKEEDIAIGNGYFMNDYVMSISLIN